MANFALPGGRAFVNPGATVCVIMTTTMMMMVMTIIMVTIMLVQFELGTSVCSSLGLIHDPTKQKITNSPSISQAAFSFTLWLILYKVSKWKENYTSTTSLRRRHMYILLLEERSAMYL